MHDVITVGIPLIAILFSRNDIKELRSEMRTRFDLVDAGLRYFHGGVGNLDARITAIEKRS